MHTYVQIYLIKNLKDKKRYTYTQHTSSENNRLRFLSSKVILLRIVTYDNLNLSITIIEMLIKIELTFYKLKIIKAEHTFFTSFCNV